MWRAFLGPLCISQIKAFVVAHFGCRALHGLAQVSTSALSCLFSKDRELWRLPHLLLQIVVRQCLSKQGAACSLTRPPHSCQQQQHRKQRARAAAECH